jgi:DNA mismatch repair protein MutS
LVTNSRQAILELEQKESIASGITSLKIRYNQVTGYYIEVTNPNLKLVPERYKHQQTLSNRKRFVTPELTELEREITQAQTEINQVEQEVYDRVKQEVEQYLPQLRQTAQGLSYLDGLYSLAHVAYSNNYVRPQFNEEHNLSISGGRHPVIETTCTTPFTSNNTVLNDNQNLLIITGPNMGGKSTYLRQVALICILAQCGSFVCATTANLPILDRIFTRIGSADNLAEGKSTFLVEMEETATICTLATQNSLVILDEVGRGTSTTDGVALAHSIIEYIHGTIKSHCLFATHYHELTQLEEELPGVKNFSMQCKKIGNTLHFLHTIAPGIARHSFGIDVAKLAQLPPEIIRRAQELLEMPPPKANSNNLNTTKPSPPEPLHGPLIKRIADLDLNSMSPKKAFDALWELQTAIKQKQK